MAIIIAYHSLLKNKPNKHWESDQDYVSFRIKWLRETRPDTIYYENEKGKQQIYPPINHYPDLKEYEVWMEGFAATGQSEEASLWGRAKARNFAEACHKVTAQRYLEHISEIELDSKHQYGMGRWDYNPSSLTYWGCKLYWSEELARKSFG